MPVANTGLQRLDLEHAVGWRVEKLLGDRQTHAGPHQEPPVAVSADLVARLQTRVARLVLAGIVTVGQPEQDPSRCP